MLNMVSYSRRPLSGQITCYLNRTYHVLPTLTAPRVAVGARYVRQCEFAAAYA
jgi:hypothetical protein